MRWVDTTDTPFSVVIPVAAGDVGLIGRTLPSWLGVSNDEVIIVIDEDAPQSLASQITNVGERAASRTPLRVVKASRTHSWRFHQAYVRRVGFREARNDLIVTGDIDLIVRRNLGEILRGPGEDNVGLTSCIRLVAPNSPARVLRSVSYLVKQKLMPPLFSGLYAFWRPYWIETEDSGIERLGNARINEYATAGLGLVGEDTYLFACMKRRYRCLHRNAVGGISLTRNVEDLPKEQFAWGRYLAATGTESATSLAASIAFAYPHLLRGYLYQRNNPGAVADPFAAGVSLQF